MELEICNWEQFNPRADRANYTWFRMQNVFFTKTFSWSCDAQRVFLYACCVASEKNSEKINFEISLAVAILRISKTKIMNALKELHETIAVIVPAFGRQEAGEPPGVIPATYERNVTNERTNDTNVGDAVAIAPPNKTNLFISAYCEAFKTKYGTFPQVKGKQAGIAGRIAAELSTERALELIRAYFSMNDHWFVTRTHDLWTMEQNLNKIIVKADTGNAITRTQIQQLDRRETTQSQLDRIKKGTL